MKIKANGITINYQIDGPDGAPCLVFSNSLATSLAMWDEQAAALKDSYRVLRYDQRGHGCDRCAGRPLFIRLRCLPMRSALLDALSIKKAHFAGLSMGGATALGLAERHPERFERIIVCDSPCQSTPQSSQQWEERIAVAQKQGIEALVEPTVARWFPPEILAKNPPHVDKVRAMIRATPVNGFIGCAAALADHDYASAVATVKRPVLFLVGEKDAATRCPCASLPKSFPVRGYVEISGAGHISNMDRPGGIHPRPSGIFWPPDRRCVDFDAARPPCFFGGARIAARVPTALQTAGRATIPRKGKAARSSLAA